MSKKPVSSPKSEQQSRKSGAIPAADKDSESDDSVKLKPFMGMRPGVYLTLLYSFILLAILFCLLILPGIINPGAQIIVKTEPHETAIRVDDVYIGLAGSKIFLPNGTYTIEAVMPGFEKQGSVQTIKGSVFASLFFPRRYNIEFRMETKDPAASFALYAADYAGWTFAGEPTAAWQIPMSLSQGASRAGPYAGNKIDNLHGILAAASRFTVTRAALRDLVRAKLLLDNFGNAPSAAALLNSISDILVFLSENPGSAGWLLDLLPPDSPLKTTLESSQWYKKSVYTPVIVPGAAGTRIELAGLNFVNIQTAHGGFYICETPVPLSLFETFLNEEPLREQQHTSYFPDEILINPLESYRSGAVTGVTWHAAEAFCLWLSGFLPESFAGMEVRLPKETEWQTASLSVSNMRLPGWEWCADPYAPLDFIAAPPDAVNLVSSPERSLRGRQSLNSAETRAFLPPDMSSPFVTFRPVIAPFNNR
ncbi:MAG: formylglycine-generating enzyme family protein [Treponema sp.]|nr:formylglycine-generating enzyme family protein [Treponema sp.]